jgi:predicted oxidoreductase
MFRLVAFLALVAAYAHATLIPQVPLCDNATECPMVSAIGVGTLHLGADNGLTDPDKVSAWVNAALELGITLFDTADVYPIKGGKSGESLRLFGQALGKTRGLREKIFIVAKTGINFPPSLDPVETCINTTSDHITQRVNWYLETLGSSYVDMLMIHFPDSFMNATEVAITFHHLKQDGKVRYFGVSNHYPSHFDALQKKLCALNTGIKLMSNQVELSVWNPRYFNYNYPVVDHAVIHGYKLMGWGALGGDPYGGSNRLFPMMPLHSTLFAGDRQSKVTAALTRVGKEIGVDDNAIVALAWLLSHPSGAVIPLIGTTQISRLQSLVTAFDHVHKFNRGSWWPIGQAGGLCALADAQCDYSGYQ